MYWNMKVSLRTEQPWMSENANGLKAVETVRQYLKEHRWSPRESETDTIFFADYVGKSGRLACEARVRPNVEIFIFYIELPVKIPEDKRLIVAEYIARINFRLFTGNLELNMDNGQLRHKSSFDFEGETVTPNLLKNTIWPGIRTIDRYMSGLMEGDVNRCVFRVTK